MSGAYLLYQLHNEMSDKSIPDLPTKKLPLFAWATLWGACLGVLFFSSYNTVNHFTSLRNDVGVYVMDWEKQIPFISWMIVPYWTIDLLYGFALFTSRNKNELFRLGKRLLLAQIICITGFLIWPLHFSFTRPSSDGLFGFLYAALSGFDLPYNQAPSLHICLLVILWRHYADIVDSAVIRWITHIWFALIGISVLTTFQHHFIDVLLGFWAGALILLIFPEAAEQWRLRYAERGEKSLRLAAYYFIASMFAVFVGALLFPNPLAWIIYWLAAALMGVAGIYIFGSPEHFGKKAQQLPWRSWMFFGPYIVGARLNAHFWTRKLPSAVNVFENIFLGPQPNQLVLKEYAVETVIDLCAELPLRANPIDYKSLPVLDLLPLPVATLYAAASAIEEASSKGNVLVCCALGFSRSAAAIAAWLILYRHFSCAQAVACLKEAKSHIVLSEESLEQLGNLISQQVISE